MKKFGCLLLTGTLLFLLCSCSKGNINGVKINDCESDIFSQKEINRAIEVTQKYFRSNFENCTLTEIGYAGDEAAQAHSDWATRNNADEVIVLISSFDTGKTLGDSGLTAEETYNNWLWILVRTSGGEWQHVDHGY